MSNKDLEKYIAASREKGLPDSEISEQLVKTGWSEDEVKKTLSNQPAANTNIPVPPPAPRFGMWLTFHYVILFISLYVVSVSEGEILHYLVNNWIPDAAEDVSNYGGYLSTLLRGLLAALIVVYPVFAFLFILAKRQIFKNPTIRNFKVRKVLIYITLVVTFLIMIWKLVEVVYSFLGGEIGTRFFAHFAITFIISGSIFFYLLNEVKEDRKLS
ncbi:MAG TPA: DUF5671 domain-containing protein [Candidatus Saccharimonadales bacterium]|nr:DUF5671 domain-containing protein [Candidatus Saccharimonadales bacterium]